MPSLRVMSRTTVPTWMWPQGWSICHRATKSGAKFCPALKKAALPRQALVMLVAALVVVVVNAVCVKAAQLASLGIWLVSVPNSPNGPEKSALGFSAAAARSEEHTSELQSRRDLVCRLLLEKKKNTRYLR